MPDEALMAMCFLRVHKLNKCFLLSFSLKTIISAFKFNVCQSLQVNPILNSKVKWPFHCRRIDCKVPCILKRQKVTIVLPWMKWLLFFSSQLHDFWRLDYWEDDLRRRRRFVRNAFGSTHADMSLKALEDYGQRRVQIQTCCVCVCLYMCVLFTLTQPSYAHIKHSNSHRRGGGGPQIEEELPQPIGGHTKSRGGANAGGRRRRRQPAAGERDRQSRR